MGGTYVTPSAPTVSAGFFLKPEGAIRVGTLPLYDALEVSSWTYTTYEASIGLQDGKSFELGQVNDLTYQHSPEFEEVEGFNLSDNAIYQVTGEETMVTVEIYEFHPEILELAIGTGNRYVLGNEMLLTFGGGCNLKNRPISVEFVNAACSVPTTPNISNGITGGILTIYDALITNGIEWSMNAKEYNTASFEFTARPVLERSLGNRLGNLNLY